MTLATMLVTIGEHEMARLLLVDAASATRAIEQPD